MNGSFRAQLPPLSYYFRQYAFGDIALSHETRNGGDEQKLVQEHWHSTTVLVAGPSTFLPPSPHYNGPGTVGNNNPTTVAEIQIMTATTNDFSHPI